MAWFKLPWRRRESALVDRQRDESDVAARHVVLPSAPSGDFSPEEKSFASAKGEEIARILNQLEKYAPEQKQEILKAANSGVSKALRRSLGGMEMLARALAGEGPRAWASDHRKEIQQFVGWHYIAITAIMRQFAQADCYVFDTASAASTQMKSARWRRAILKSSNMNQSDQLGEPLPDSHPLTRLLLKPNPKQVGSSFRAEVAMQRRLTGGCLIWNVPNVFGVTVERYVLPRGACTPQMPSKDFPEGSWKVQLDSARYGSDGWYMMGTVGQFLGYEIDARQVQFVKDHHPQFKDDAQSPVSATALWTDTLGQIDQSRHSHLINGPDPSIAIALPDNVDPDEDELKRVRARFNEEYQGTKKHGKAIFMTQAKEITALGTPIKDMNYAEGWTQLRDAILAVHGVPPIAVGVVQPTAREGLYAPLLQFTELTIQPMLDENADSDTEAIAKQHGESLVIEYVAASVDDPDRKETELQNDIAAGAVKVNEIRQAHGRELWDDEEGDVIVGQGQQAVDPMNDPAMLAAAGGDPNVLAEMQMQQMADANGEQQLDLFGEPTMSGKLEKMFKSQVDANAALIKRLASLEAAVLKAGKGFGPKKPKRTAGLKPGRAVGNSYAEGGTLARTTAPAAGTPTVAKQRTSKPRKPQSAGVFASKQQREASGDRRAARPGGSGVKPSSANGRRAAPPPARKPGPSFAGGEHVTREGTKHKVTPRGDATPNRRLSNKPATPPAERTHRSGITTRSKQGAKVNTGEGLPPRSTDKKRFRGIARNPSDRQLVSPSKSDRFKVEQGESIDSVIKALFGTTNNGHTNGHANGHAG